MEAASPAEQDTLPSRKDNIMSRTWLVTGASSGLGRALALAVSEAGERVVATVRNPADAAALEAGCPGLVALIADLTEAGSPARTVAEAEERCGPIDVLVNNAGRGFTAAVEEASDTEVHDVFAINFTAPLHMIQAVLPGMRARREGLILNVTSISGFKPWSGTGIYCASKFALEGLGQTLAQEVAGFGIRVVNVQPGSLRTDFNGRSLGASATTIDAYSEGAHFARHALARSDGKQSGDPARAAQAILAVSRSSAPPMNLVLGKDAVAMAEERIARLNQDLADWAPYSASIGFDTMASNG
jgi:NAD(P)-dependent dehydrogenase (short-subunit alcohol dehydrogenase family)